MKRKMSFLEGSMFAGKNTPVNLIFTVTVEGCLSQGNLEKALQKVQNRHPLLKIVVWQDEKGIPWYVSPDKIQPIPLRIVERNSDKDWRNEAEKEWHKLFDVEKEPLTRLVWVRSERTSELILVCHHCICDATSVMQLMHEILEVADNPGKDIGSYQAVSSLMDLVPVDIQRNMANIFTANLITGMTRFYLGVVSWMKEKKKDHFYTINWKLNSDMTGVILEKCKEEGLSINTVLSLTFMKAFQNVRHLSTNRRMFCSVDARRFLPEIGSDHLFPFPVMIDLSLGNKQYDFWHQARYLRDKLYNKIEKTDIRKMLMYTEQLVSLLPKSIRYAKAGKGLHDFAFANLGKIKIREHYETFSIQNVYSPSSRFPMGNPTKISTSTFRGQIDFVFTSEEGFLKYQDALLVKENAMQLLLNQTITQESSVV
ncbi:condensation domain-containing protein [Dyadobacter sp. LHD-138]|uniref:condensation domain-containing protein n=1 Tax=Dyadobacter sp. LHD-138 TaxID=3071413 RepID=UPI0027DF4DB3|nr:condensation domain-containing protein [Dyadobacter sp. LHD-138]MDQ6481335.1 condensation domain-containing protein [Dyadobacter sp. LHD-138]